MSSSDTITMHILDFITTDKCYVVMDMHFSCQSFIR